MQNNRFVVLTGHLSNYPLSDLVGILRHQRKSGRLLIEFPKGPATFFFQNGELIDARMNDLTGLQAICVALAEPDASFNFNPLIMSPRRTIEPSFQRAVAELFGCWDESALQIESTVTPASLEGATIKADGNGSRTLTGRRSEPLALPAGPSAPVQRRSLLLISAVIVMVGLLTLIAVTGGFTRSEVATAAPATPAAVPAQAPAPGMAPVGGLTETLVHKPAPAAAAKTQHVLSERKQEKQTEPEPQTQGAPAAAAPEAAQSAQAVKVVMQIENGRVLKASIANHKAGMDSYEALALRIARQRRYPATHTGGETVTINVDR